MSKGSFVSLPVIIFFVVGIIGIALLVPIVIDVYNRMVHGKCWADIQETVSNIKSDLKSISLSGGETSKSTYRRITVGECVGAVMIFNKAEKGSYASSPPNLARFESLINDVCSSTYSGYGSYIMVLPWKTVKEEMQTSETLWEKWKRRISWKNYQDWYKEAAQSLKFLKPTCTGMEGTWNNVYFLPPEVASMDAPLNEKDTTACYELTKSAISNKPGAFEYSLAPAADTKCPDILPTGGF
jgi:hypothetical protein